MKKIQIVINLGGKACKFDITANTEFDATELLKAKLIDSLRNKKITVTGLA